MDFNCERLFHVMVVFLNVNGSHQRRVVQDVKLCLFFSLVKLPRLRDAEQENYILHVYNGF